MSSSPLRFTSRQWCRLRIGGMKGLPQPTASQKSTLCRAGVDCGADWALVAFIVHGAGHTEAVRAGIVGWATPAAPRPLTHTPQPARCFSVRRQLE
eukprot:3852747-Prymnesium_polylepis.1